MKQGKEKNIWKGQEWGSRESYKAIIVPPLSPSSYVSLEMWTSHHMEQDFRAYRCHIFASKQKLSVST